MLDFIILTNVAQVGDMCIMQLSTCLCYGRSLNVIGLDIPRTPER